MSRSGRPHRVRCDARKWSPHCVQALFSRPQSRLFGVLVTITCLSDAVAGVPYIIGESRAMDELRDRSVRELVVRPQFEIRPANVTNSSTWQLIQQLRPGEGSSMLTRAPVDLDSIPRCDACPSLSVVPLFLEAIVPVWLPFNETAGKLSISMAALREAAKGDATWGESGLHLPPHFVPPQDRKLTIHASASVHDAFLAMMGLDGEMDATVVTQSDGEALEAAASDPSALALLFREGMVWNRASEWACSILVGDGAVNLTSLTVSEGGRLSSEAAVDLVTTNDSAIARWRRSPPLDIVADEAAGVWPLTTYWVLVAPLGASQHCGNKSGQNACPFGMVNMAYWGVTSLEAGSALSRAGLEMMNANLMVYAAGTLRGARCGRDGLFALGQTLGSGVGASLPGELYQRLANSFRVAEVNRRQSRVVYVSTSSGRGRKWLKTDPSSYVFAGSDSKPDLGSGFVVVPTVATGVVPAYNIPKLGSSGEPVTVTQDVLGKLFLGNITRWDDPEIKACNPPSVRDLLPAQQIKLLMRDESSGTVTLWRAALAKLSPGLWSNASATFAGEGLELSNGAIASIVASEPYTLTVLPLALAISRKLGRMSLRMGDDPPISCSQSSVREALRLGIRNPSSLDDVPSTIALPGRKGAWPAVAVTHLLFLPKYAPRRASERYCREAALAHSFVRWTLVDDAAAAIITTSGFVRLPSAVIGFASKQLDTITCNGWNIARTCREGHGLINGSCVKCPKGSVSAGYDNDPDAGMPDVENTGICVHCPPGKFADREGSTMCTPCSNGSFASSSGSEQCEQCPKHMTSVPGSTCREDCVCREGRYLSTPRLQPDQIDPCKSCSMLGVNTAKCFNTTKATLPLELGYWSSPLTTDFEVLRCPHENRCRGGTTSKPQCASGTQGVMCLSCAAGFYQDVVTGECFPCKGRETGMGLVHITLLAVLAAIALCFVFPSWCARSRLKSAFLVQLVTTNEGQLAGLNLHVGACTRRMCACWSRRSGDQVGVEGGGRPGILSSLSQRPKDIEGDGRHAIELQSVSNEGTERKQNLQSQESELRIGRRRHPSLGSARFAGSVPNPMNTVIHAGTVSIAINGTERAHEGVRQSLASPATHAHSSRAMAPSASSAGMAGAGSGRLATVDDDDDDDAGVDGEGEEEEEGCIETLEEMQMRQGAAFKWRSAQLPSHEGQARRVGGSDQPHLPRAGDSGRNPQRRERSRGDLPVGVEGLDQRRSWSLLGRSKQHVRGAGMSGIGFLDDATGEWKTLSSAEAMLTEQDMDDEEALVPLWMSWCWQLLAVDMLSKLKTLATHFQLLLAVREALNVQLPGSIAPMLGVFSLVDGDVNALLKSLACAGAFSFTHRFLVGITFPVAIVGGVAVLYGTRYGLVRFGLVPVPSFPGQRTCVHSLLRLPARSAVSGSIESLMDSTEGQLEGLVDSIGRLNCAYILWLRAQCASAVLGWFELLAFLVYPSLSRLILRYWDCDTRLDPPYLREDYSVACTDQGYSALGPVAVLSSILYPVGIPVVLAALLGRYRHVFFPNAVWLRPKLLDSTGRVYDPARMRASLQWISYRASSPRGVSQGRGRRTASSLAREGEEHVASSQDVAADYCATRRKNSILRLELPSTGSAAGRHPPLVVHLHSPSTPHGSRRISSGLRYPAVGVHGKTSVGAAEDGTAGSLRGSATSVPLHMQDLPTAAPPPLPLTPTWMRKREPFPSPPADRSTARNASVELLLEIPQATLNDSRERNMLFFRLQRALPTCVGLGPALRELTARASKHREPGTDPVPASKDESAHTETGQRAASATLEFRRAFREDAEALINLVESWQPAVYNAEEDHLYRQYFTPERMQRYARLVGPYQPRLWYWELVEQVRRLVLSTLVFLTGTHVRVHVVVALLAAGAFLAVMHALSPYRRTENNALSLASQWLLLLMLLCTLLQELGRELNAAGRTSPGTIADFLLSGDALGGIILISNALFLAFAAVLLVRSIQRARRELAEKALSFRTSRLLMHQRQLEHSSEPGGALGRRPVSLKRSPRPPSGAPTAPGEGNHSSQ